MDPTNLDSQLDRNNVILSGLFHHSEYTSILVWKQQLTRNYRSGPIQILHQVYATATETWLGEPSKRMIQGCQVQHSGWLNVQHLYAHKHRFLRGQLEDPFEELQPGSIQI